MVKEYVKRFSFCIASLALFALGNFFGVKAGMAGTNAWNTLALGLGESLGLSFGRATLLISVIIILVDLLGKGKLGFGTLLNALLVSFFSDIYLNALDFFPAAPNAVLGVVYTLVGQVILSFATILYMSPGLGCGPRDTLMVIIGKKMPKAPIGVVKFCMEMGALLVGVLMGAPFGIGTVLIMLLQAAIFQFACRVTHYEPRNVVHEDVLETCRRIFKRA